MNNKMGKILYSIDNSHLIIKMQGILRFDQGGAMDECLSIIKSSNNIFDVIFDMTQLKLLDSTILGQITQVALLVKNKIAKEPVVYYKEQDVLWALKTIGIDKFFVIKQGEMPEVENYNFKEIKAKDDSKTEIVKRIVNAHDSLSIVSGSKSEDYKNLQDLLRGIKK